jgi:hypothetical protein
MVKAPELADVHPFRLLRCGLSREGESVERQL